MNELEKRTGGATLIAIGRKACQLENYPNGHRYRGLAYMMENAPI
jgi:hypothetical protein